MKTEVVSRVKMNMLVLGAVASLILLEDPWRLAQ